MFTSIRRQGLFHDRVLFLSLVSWITFGGALAFAEDWTQFRGPDGQGISSSKSFPTEWSENKNLLWKIALPGAGTSSPVFFGDNIYITCHSGYAQPGEPGSIDRLKRHVVCLRRDNGRLVWNSEVPTILPEEENIRDGHGYASSTPAVDKDGVYLFFGKSGVFAFDHKGKQKWHADVGSGTHGWGSAASPVLFDEWVIINASVESQSLIALNKKTGKQVWLAPEINEAWNTPIFVTLPGGKTELVMAVHGKILGFDPRSGNPLWSCDTDIPWYMVPGLVADDGVVYCIGGRSGGSLAVRAGGRGNVTSSHRIWTGRKGSNVSSPVFHKGHLYWMHENQGIAYCVEGKSGRVVYEERVNRAGQIYASAILAGGKILYLSRQGQGFVVPATPQFKLLATNSVDAEGAFNSSPVVFANNLYLRDDKYLYCFGEK